MNSNANRALLALVACFAALALKPLHAAPPQSTPVFFIGDSIPYTPASNALDPASWSGGALPKETDDVVVIDLFHLNGPAGVVRMKSLVNDRSSQIFFNRASLSVTGNVTLDSSLEFQSRQATLTVGGSLFVQNGALSFVAGLAEGKRGEPVPRFTGNSLKVGFGAGIRLRWFYEVPEGIPGNTVPFIRLSGDALFDLSSYLNVVLADVAHGLSPGEYLLLTAEGAIKGPLPALTILNEPPGAKTKSELKLSPNKRKLLLVVTEMK